MEIEAVLATMAEVGVTLAGFSGLVLVLAPRRSDAREGLARLALIVAICLAIVLCALLPPPLANLGLHERLIWGLPASLLGTLQMLVLVATYILGRRRILRSSARQVSRYVINTSMVVFCVLIIAPILPIATLPSVFALGCLWAVIYAGIMFLLSVWWTVYAAERDEASS